MARPKKTTRREPFRFEGKALVGIAVAVSAAGVLLLALIWEAADQLGFLTAPAADADRSLVPSSLVLVSLIFVGVFLLTAGTIILFAEIKEVIVDTSEEVKPAPTEDGGKVTLLPGAAAAQITETLATGLGKLKGGAVAVFGGIIMFVLAGWITLASLDSAADEPQRPAPSAEAP